MKMRIDTDSLGEVEVPSYTYYGAETQRAITNYPISGYLPHPAYITSIVLIKKAAALVHKKLNQLSAEKAVAIVQTCDEILNGKFADQFVVDPYQAGAGTSLHMNVNEVIANRANEILGAPLGSFKYINPHDHVNMSQSTNDVIPASIRIMILLLLPDLDKALEKLETTLHKKSKEFELVIKSGRTHLQDALPITLGQEFAAYRSAISHDRTRIEQSAQNLLRLGIGGTAVGTGINSHPHYHRLMIDELKTLTKIPFVLSENLFESMQMTADFLDASSSLKILATTLIKIGNDLRLLSSGPATGLGEITLPHVQAGSSIMPGKQNPSIVEMLTMVCFQVIGYETAITHATTNGQLELNVFLPLISFNLSEQMRLLTNSITVFESKCVAGIAANEEHCRNYFERSVGLGAILNTIIGYDKAVEVVNHAREKNISIKKSAIEMKYITEKQATELFDMHKLTQ